MKHISSNKDKTDNQCIISDKPSTMDDTKHCIFNKNNRMNDLFTYESDLCEEDKFRVCFIDCSCNCLAKKITQGRIIPKKDLGIFEDILKNFKSNNYNVSCHCYCGDNQQRLFSFNYCAGQQQK